MPRLLELIKPSSNQVPVRDAIVIAEQRELLYPLFDNAEGAFAILSLQQNSARPQFPVTQKLGLSYTHSRGLTEGMRRPKLIDVEFAMLAFLIGGAFVHGILTGLMRLRY